MPTWVDRLLNSQFVQLGLAALAFLIALWLVVVIARMLMGGRLRLPGGRTRQARLGIVDAFDLDRQRQLIIVRRDNTEHLIMIGGPNDLVIESEIVRVEAREFREARRDKVSDNGGDLRVPAPTALPALDGLPSGEIAPGARMDEPLLPMPLPTAPAPHGANAPADTPPEAPARVVEPAAPKGPTFPLPPRRPAPPAAIAPLERRPPPVLPDRATRAEDVPVREEAAPETGAAGELAARPAPLSRPLPPRTPLRPLKRTTPQAEPGQQPPRRIEPTPSAGPTPQNAGRPLPPNLPPLPTPAASGAPPAEEGLESLEEEMAKLLGR